MHRPEHRDHRDVDPDVDRAELGLDPLGRALDLFGVGDVAHQDQRPAACRLDLGARRLEAVAAARDQADRGAARPERPRGRAPDARGRAGHDHDLGSRRLHLHLAFRAPPDDRRAPAAAPTRDGGSIRP
jgi:hypothetical protein